MPVVMLANGKAFPVADNKSILEEAKSCGIALEYSCRTGRCGVCQAHVSEGETIVIQSEEALTQDELAGGLILTCCRAALTDLALNINDLGRLADIEMKTLPCRINSINLVAPDVVEVMLRLPPNSIFKYLAGQYINIIFKNLRRSYSIANFQRNDNTLTLHIRRVENGEMSGYWFNEAKVNDLLRLEGPLGTFCLRDAGPTNIIFLATGTGIAPVKAMLEELTQTPELFSNKEIRVYWGGRTSSDIYWNVSFGSLKVKFLPVLSQPDNQWDGLTGYVQHTFLDDHVDLTDSVIYACGSDAMIHSARTLLTSAGLASNKFYSDAFVSSN